MPGANSKTMYVAVIGDLVASRSLESDERIRVQSRFNDVLERINENFSGEIASKFLITAGDETQGILKGPNQIYELLREIQFGLEPTEIVFGVGHGTITTDIGEYAVGADGPALQYARQALEKAKEERKVYGKSVCRETRFLSEDSIRDTVINALFLALSVLRNTWTKKQRQVLELLERGDSPSDVAKTLDMPLPNVSRTVDTTYFREYEQIVVAIRTELEQGKQRAGKVIKKTET